MEQVLAGIVQNLDYFVLVFMRVTALILSSPIFGRKNVPNMAKIGLCLALTYVVFTAFPVAVAQGVEIGGIWEFAFLCIKELLFGLVIGYVTTLFFSVAQTAGYAIDMQMGFGMVNVFDVQNNISVPLTGNFLYIILTICFFAVNGHHQLIYILYSTFEIIPPGAVMLRPEIGIVAMQVFVLAFLLAVNVALPFIASGLIGELVLGFMVRTTPQLNVFVVGIPLKVLLGFMVLSIMLPIYVNYTGSIFNEMFRSVDAMLQGLAGG